MRARLASGELEVGHMVNILGENGEGSAHAMSNIYPLVRHSRTKAAAQLVETIHRFAVYFRV